VNTAVRLRYTDKSTDSYRLMTSDSGGSKAELGGPSASLQDLFSVTYLGALAPDPPV